MSTDFIPSADTDFDGFFTAFNAYVLANAGQLNLTNTQSTVLDNLHTTWETAWGNWQAEQNTYDALLAAKNTARDNAVTLIRQLNAAVQADPTVTDTTREAAGLPVHKATRTPVAPIETHPVLYRVDNEHVLQRLWFSDQTTPGSKAKPKGASLCEIRQALVAPGGAAPSDPNAMALLALDTKSPHRTDFDPTDVGKTAYYCQRWVNTTGTPGPWGMITSYPVT